MSGTQTMNLFKSKVILDRIIDKLFEQAKNHGGDSLIYAEAMDKIDLLQAYREEVFGERRKCPKQL